MYKFNINNLLRLSTILIILLAFLLGGFLQFFFGIPATIYSIGILGIIYFFILLDILNRKKVVINKVILIGLLYLLLMVISGIWNLTNIIKIAFYSLFALTPIAFVYYFTILKKREINDSKIIYPLIKLIVFVQLPVILIQKYAYSYLIHFNNSNQEIADVDFMFGTFPIKADHSLGFFLIMFLLNIFFRVRSGYLKKVPWVTISYVSLTILLMESNLTKIVLALVFSFYISLWIFKKFRFSGIILIIGTIYLIFQIAMTNDVISKEVYHFQNAFTPVESEKAVTRGYAKRPQVLIYKIYNEPISLIGEGPYDYFNILTSKFKNTIHFSQIIWTYNDLGLAGLFIIFILVFQLLKKFNIKKESRSFLTIILLLYLFMTNVFGDIGMMLSLFILLKEQRINNV